MSKNKIQLNLSTSQKYLQQALSLALGDQGGNLTCRQTETVEQYLKTLKT